MTVISCEEVQRAVSSYMDVDLPPELRLLVDAHVKQCKPCTAIYDGVRNVITLFGAGSIIELPSGFSARLYQRLCADPACI